VSTSTITVQLKDASGNNLIVGGDTVVLNTSSGTLGSVTDNSNGTYTAILTSDTITGTATISGTVGMQTILDTATVMFISGSASKLAFVQQPTNTLANDTIIPAITVQLKDQNGNNVASSGVTIRITLSYGTGTLSGIDTVLTDGNGLATFLNLSIESIGFKMLTAISDGLTSANSDTFSIVDSCYNSIALVMGWNMVSVPLVLSDYTDTSIFPELYGSVIEYIPGYSYGPASNLELGKGYWLNYLTADTVNLSGTVPGPIIVQAKQGWNIIGSRNTPVDISTLILSDGATIYSDAVFIYVSGYGYNPLTVIQPGQGVWIYLSKDCTITFPE
jgi:hypothetical protein